MCLGPLIRREATGGRLRRERKARKGDRHETAGSEEGRHIFEKTSQGESERETVEERTLDLESGREQRLRWQRGLF